jgi:hypothetical protein
LVFLPALALEDKCSLDLLGPLLHFLRPGLHIIVVLLVRPKLGFSVGERLVEILI